jgi:hypothetical protein
MLSRGAEVIIMLARLLPCLLAAVIAGGCAGSGTVAYSTTGSVYTPDLVAVGGGVSVIADYDEPIFYANNYYWWPTSRGWYRSRTYTGGWVYDAAPPRVVARIDSPYRYRHYRPSNYTVRRRPVEINRVQRPTIYYDRDHRTERDRHNRR